MKTKLYVLAFIVCLTFSAALQAQVTIGSNEYPHQDALLDLKNQTGGKANKGLLLPRVTLKAINDKFPLTTADAELNNAAGMAVYNTATAGAAPNNVIPGYYYWDGTQWVRLATDNLTGSFWSLTGNSGNTAANFLGTTDNQALNFKTNAATDAGTKMIILPNGNVGIGTNAPKTKLDIVASAPGTGFKLADGSQGKNKVLVSDIDGTASWKDPIQYAIKGVIPESVQIPVTTSSHEGCTGCYIDLPAGDWIVKFSNWIVPGGSAGVLPSQMIAPSVALFLSISCTENIPPTYLIGIKSILINPIYLWGTNYTDFYGVGEIPIRLTSPQRVYLWTVAGGFWNQNLVPNSPNTNIAHIYAYNNDVGGLGPYTFLYATPVNFH